MFTVERNEWPPPRLASLGVAPGSRRVAEQARRFQLGEGPDQLSPGQVPSDFKRKEQKRHGMQLETIWRHGSCWFSGQRVGWVQTTQQNRRRPSSLTPLATLSHLPRARYEGTGKEETIRRTVTIGESKWWRKKRSRIRLEANPWCLASQLEPKWENERAQRAWFS